VLVQQGRLGPARPRLGALVRREGHDLELLEPGCSAAIRVRGRVAEDLRRGCGRSSGLDVVNDVGENHIIEDTEAGLHNSLAGAEQFRAIGNAEPGSPRLGYGLLVGVTAVGGRWEAGDLGHVNARIWSGWRVKRSTSVLVTQTHVDAQGRYWPV